MDISSLDIRSISFLELWSNGHHLFEDHCKELEDDRVTFLPDQNRYLALDDLDMLIVLGAYVDEHMVGYSVSVIYRHGHFDEILATNDSLYVDPDYRRGSLGWKLILSTEKSAQECGVSRMLWTAKCNSNLEILLQKRRAQVSSVFCKEF
jgi:predicted GNAT superfamily acetyltransferase